MNNRSLGLACGLTAMLAACGGGLLALLPFVAAIGGFWQGVDDSAETLSFSTQGGQNNLYGGEQESYPATLNSASRACGGAPAVDLALTARFNGKDFTLSLPNAATACLNGSFVDDITLVLKTGGDGTKLRNALGLQPLFEQGVWANIDRTTQRLKFRDDAATVNGVTTQTGCEFAGNATSGAVVVSFRQRNPNAGETVVIDSIVITRSSGVETWTNGSLFGASGVKIDAGGSTVSLQRRDEALNC